LRARQTQPRTADRINRGDNKRGKHRQQQSGDPKLLVSAQGDRGSGSCLRAARRPKTQRRAADRTNRGDNKARKTQAAKERRSKASRFGPRSCSQPRAKRDACEQNTRLVPFGFDTIQQHRPMQQTWMPTYPAGGPSLLLLLLWFKV